MVDVFHYLELRAQGLTRGHHFRECRKVVRNLLEDVSANPVHNLPCEFSGEPRATFLMDFSPNMLRVASTHGDHTVRVTDIRTGKCTHILTGHPRTPWCLAFNPASNDILASGCLGGEIRIWDLLGGGSEVLLNPCVGQVITSLAFHPTGQVLVFATMNYIYFWDWSQATPFSFTRTTHDYERIRWLRFDPLGRYLYTGIANNTTVHRDREGVARVVAINDALDLSAEGDDRSTQQHLNRLRYQRLLQRFMAFQQDHNRPAYPGMPPLSPESRSPVHEEALDNARQYARHMTNIATRTSSNNVEPSSSSYPILALHRRRNASSRPPTSQPSTSQEDFGSTGQESRSSNWSVPRRLEDAQARRRWGRYEPFFFSRQTSQGNNNNNSGLGDSNNNSNNNNYNYGHGSYSSYRPEVPARSASSLDRLFTLTSRPWEENCHRARPSLFSTRPAETSGSSAASSSQPSSLYHGTRNENAASESLDANEFEILPVDQEREARRNNGTNGSSSSGVLSNAEGSNNNVASWEELRALLNRIANRSNEESSASSGAATVTGVPPPWQPMSSSAASTAEGSDSGSRFSLGVFRPTSAPQAPSGDSGTADLSNPILNLDTFLGSGNLDTFEVPSARVSSSSQLSSRLASQLLPPRPEPPPTQQESISSVLRNPEGAPQAMGTSDNTGVHIHFDNGVSHSWRRGLGLRHHSVDEESEFRLHSSLLDRSVPRHVIDQTSQTLGAMNLPESSDQCTDVSDLGEHHPHAGVSGSGKHQLQAGVSGLGKHHQQAEVSSSGGSHLMGEGTSDAVGHSDITEMCIRRNANEQSDENVYPLQITIPRETLGCELSNEEGGLAYRGAISKTTDGQGVSSIHVNSRSKKNSSPAANVISNLRDEACILPLKKRGRVIDSTETVENDADFSTSKHACPLHVLRQTGSLVGDGSSPAGPSQQANNDSLLPRQVRECEGQANNQPSTALGDGQTSMSSDISEGLVENCCPSIHKDKKPNTSVVPEPEMYSPERPTSDYSEIDSSAPEGTTAAESLLDMRVPSMASVHAASSTSSSSTSSPSSSPSLSLSSVISSSSQDTPASSALLGTTSLHLLPIISMSSQSARGPPDSPGVSSRYTPRENSAPQQLNRAIPTLTNCVERRPSQTVSNGRSSPNLDDEPFPSVRPSLFSTTLFPRSTSESILRSSLVRPSSSDIRSGLRRFNDSTEPSAFSIFSTSARESTRSPSVFRTSSLLNPASANPASSARLFLPAIRAVSDQLSTSSPPEGDASSQRQLNTVRDVQERLQQAVQQLREVHTSVRELSSTAPSDDMNIVGPDSVTEYLERRVSELDRRISDLEESYNSRIRELRHDFLMRRIQTNRERRRPVNNSPYFRRYSARLRDSLRGRERGSSSLESNTSTSDVNLRGSSRPVDDRGDAPPAHHQRTGQLLQCLVRQDTSLPSTSQRSSRAPEMPASVTIRPARDEDSEDSSQRYYLNLHHAHLHPDYSSSILDDTINRPTDTVQRIMNRTIAGAFLTRDDQAVASNIVPQTHRIQRWDVSKCVVPDITNASINIVVKHCKLHNDASCDLSKDGQFLATFVPSHRGFPDDNILGVFSLRKESLAHCLYTKSFGPNAISVSISPENRYVMVGLAAKRLFFFSVNQMVGQVYRLAKEKAGESSMRHVTDLFHPCNQDSRNHVSVNSARWLPGVGEGMVYGTNRGDLHFCRPGSRKVHERDSPKPRGPAGALESMIRLHRNHSIHNSIATQTTTVSIRRSASTQTSREDDHHL